MSAFAEVGEVSVTLTHRRGFLILFPSLNLTSLNSAALCLASSAGIYLSSGIIVLWAGPGEKKK